MLETPLLFSSCFNSQKPHRLNSDAVRYPLGAARTSGGDGRRPAYCESCCSRKECGKRERSGLYACSQEIKRTMLRRRNERKSREFWRWTRSLPKNLELTHQVPPSSLKTLDKRSMKQRRWEAERCGKGTLQANQMIRSLHSCRIQANSQTSLSSCTSQVWCSMHLNGRESPERSNRTSKRRIRRCRSEPYS